MSYQDMPPPSGFGSIHTDRTPPRVFIRQGYWFALGFFLSIYGPFRIAAWQKKLFALRMEQTEHYIAAEPFLLAEQERKFLLAIHHTREEERERMKHVEGWKVGTLYGERRFKTLPPNALPSLCPEELTLFRPSSEYSWRSFIPDLND